MRFSFFAVEALCVLFCCGGFARVSCFLLCRLFYSGGLLQFIFAVGAFCVFFAVEALCVFFFAVGAFCVFFFCGGLVCVFLLWRPCAFFLLWRP